MPQLRGIIAVVQFLRQSAEPCAAPPTSPFMALLTEPRAVQHKLVSRAVHLSVAAPFLLFCEAPQSCCSALGPWRSDVSHFPQVKSLFQLQVPVDTFRNFSKEQATTAAAEQSPGLATTHDSFETFRPSSGTTRDPAPREARRSSVSRYLSRSVRATSRMGQFESGRFSCGCEL